MKRPALWVGLPFVMGLVLASLCVRQLWLPVCGGVTLVSLAVVLWRRTLWKYVLLGTLSCLTACCVYWAKDAVVTARQMPYAGQETTFSGTVCDVTVYPSGYARYYLNGRFEGTVPARVELFCESPYYRYGDHLTLHGTPERLQSGYLSDNAAYARTQDVFLRFGMLTETLSYTPEDHPGLRASIGRWRSRMTERILSCMGEETGPMLTGMLFGDKTAMSHGSKQALYRIGIGHVLAVSGLHLDFLALCISWLLEKLRAGKWLRFALMAVVCGLFVIVAGETFSVERACIMILIRESGQLLHRKADPFSSLSIAAFLLCLTHPFVIHGAAFWLSCTAVWGIAVLAPYMTKGMPIKTFRQTAWRDFASLCWTFLATIPVCAYWFGEIALLTAPVNAVLIPVCMAAMLLGALGVCFGAQGFLAELLLSGADWLCGIVLRVGCFAAKLPYTHAAMGSRMLLCIIGAGILLVAGVQLLGKDKKRTGYTAAAALTVTCVLLGMRQELLGNSLRVAVLGKDKSCVLAVVGGDEAALFDMSGNSGMAIYAQTYLTENGIDRLQTLCLAKPGRKTAGQYAEYFALMPPEEVVLLQESEDFTDVLGVQGVTDERRDMLFHGAHLSAQSDCVTVEYAGMTLLCCKETAVTGEPEVLIISGKSTEALPDCGILIIPDPASPYVPDGHTYIGETNFEVTLGRDGTCRVRRLYGDH